MRTTATSSQGLEQAQMIAKTKFLDRVHTTFNNNTETHGRHTQTKRKGPIPSPFEARLSQKRTKKNNFSPPSSIEGKKITKKKNRKTESPFVSFLLRCSVHASKYALHIFGIFVLFEIFLKKASRCGVVVCSSSCSVRRLHLCVFCF
jgi:hypothetical protein